MGSEVRSKGVHTVQGQPIMNADDSGEKGSQPLRIHMCFAGGCISRFNVSVDLRSHYQGRMWVYSKHASIWGDQLFAPCVGLARWAQNEW